MTINIYTTTNCSYCKIAKRYFHDRDIPFEEKNVTIDEEARKVLTEKYGTMSVPVIVINDTPVMGWNKARIEELLA